MKTENKLRFGHRVIAWDSDKSKAVKGRYISEYRGYSNHLVKPENENEVEAFKNCELDLDATKFVSGDRVQVGHCNKKEATYIGFDNERASHIVLLDDALGNYSMWSVCRYPIPEPPKQFIFTDDMTRSQITSQIDEMLKSWGKE